MSQTPSLADQGDLLKNYLAINRDLRQANNKALAGAGAAVEAASSCGREPFRQLSNSQVEAQFADHRVYTYQGQEVDQQDHLGYDLATTAQRAGHRRQRRRGGAWPSTSGSTATRS